MNAYRELLDHVVRVRGIRAAMLVGEDDGLVVAEALSEGVDGAAVAALAASLTMRIRRVSAAAGLAAPAVVQMRAEQGALLTVQAGDGLLVVAIAGRETDLGLARLELREAAQRLHA